MTSLQELEKINAEEYKENPSELIKIAKNFLNLKKFEKGIELLEQAIHFAIEKNNKDETNIECAKFYYHYADALIRKCMESDEILAIPEADVAQEPQEQSNIQTNNIQSVQKIKEVEEEEEEGENPAQEDDDEEKEEVVQDDSDEQVALENLLFAEKIYKTYLNPYETKKKEDLSDEVIKIFFELGAVYHKFGELEMCKSDFKSAVDFFIKSLEIRNKFDFKFSRAIAELYFNMASAFDFDSKKCLLCYYKTKIIMEYHLQQELIKINFNKLADLIIISDSDMELETIKITDPCLKLNREIMNHPDLINDQMMKNEEIEELTSIIQELNIKIDDVIIDITAFENYTKEKEKLSQEENKFQENYDKTKVEDVQRLVKKRQRKDENHDINEENGVMRLKVENHKSEDKANIKENSQETQKCDNN